VFDVRFFFSFFLFPVLLEKKTTRAYSFSRGLILLLHCIPELLKKLPIQRMWEKGHFIYVAICILHFMVLAPLLGK